MCRWYARRKRNCWSWDSRSWRWRGLLKRACATQLAEGQRARLDTQLRAALEVHHRIAHQSRRLTQGKAVSHCKIVNAYDPTIAPFVRAKATVSPSLAASPG